MKVYRLTKRKYANDLTGFGAKIVGGRWNSKGRSILYTASTKALALLEILVHLSPTLIPDDYVIVEIDIPDDLLVTNVDASLLPTDRSSYPINSLTQWIGDNWLENNVAIALRVPSAIVTSEYNILINPENSGFERVKINSIKPFEFDSRLISEEKEVVKTDPIIQKRLQQISSFKYDVFISHAYEDKEEVVMPIVREINKYGLRYWYDSEQLKLGDSITKKINSGINESRFLLAVISSTFVNKNWTMTELQTALNMQFSNGTLKVLPILVVKNNDKEYILNNLAFIRDLVYIVWENNAEEIVNVIAERLSAE